MDQWYGFFYFKSQQNQRISFILFHPLPFACEVIRKKTKKIRNVNKRTSSDYFTLLLLTIVFQAAKNLLSWPL